VTLIHAGAHKVDGNPYEPLPESVRDELEAEVEQLRGLFAETVAAGRPRVSAAAALATEAQVFRGPAAVAAGLADEVRDLRSAFDAFVRHVSARPRSTDVMTTTGSAPKQEDSMLENETGPLAEEETADAPRDDDAAPETEAEPPAAEPQQEESAQDDVITPSAEQIDRSTAAALAEIGAQAARLGVKVDVAKAIRAGMSPERLRAEVLEQAAARSDATDVVAANPTAGRPKESPIVAKARQSRDQALRN
jgi:ClpP class serine protease